MNTKVKKILIIVIAILVLALAAFLIYNLLIKPESSKEPEGTSGLPESEKGTTQPNQEDEFTPQPEQRVKTISSEPVASATLTQDQDQIIYYSQTSGNVWTANFDGSDLTKFSEASLENLLDVLWSPDKTKVITIFQDNLGKIQKYFYSYETKKALPLSEYMKEIAWSPSSDRIAYHYYNSLNDINTINLSNPDGSNYSTILNTRMKDIDVKWPKGSEVYIYEKPSGLAQSSLYALNTYTRGFTKILSDIYGFSPKWSKDGTRILYSKTDSRGEDIEIYTTSSIGSNPESAGISTLAEKCIWSQDPRMIYCAIPENIDKAKTLPDDFYKGTFQSIDKFWKINVETGEKTQILADYEILEVYDATNLFLSPEEDFLFFINKTNGLLYSIEL
ncbi:MAG: hypothetical protein GF387_02865 [Candidatus Portnoybacteria bacterium]|nr:hypothetical protein [Candidatus Portnoybacteria bacterium]